MCPKLSDAAGYSLTSAKGRVQVWPISTKEPGALAENRMREKYGNPESWQQRVTCYKGGDKDHDWSERYVCAFSKSANALSVCMRRCQAASKGESYPVFLGWTCGTRRRAAR